MKFISILFSGLLLAFSSAASAQNYYVCDNGDDNNDGRSEATPFQTYEKAMDTFTKMFAGESILFCRGGTFEITERWWIWNYRCSADKPCIISSYGNESLPKPRLVSNGETAINFQNRGNSRPDGGYIVSDLVLISNTNQGSGIAMYNDVNDLLINNVHIEGFSVGVHAAGANSPEQGSNQANDRIVLSNSTIINNASQGWLGGCNDCVIENNHFENNGFKGATFYHSIYIDSPVKSQDFKVRNITVRNNTIKHSTRVDGVCQGTSFVVHGIVENLKIHNNQLIEDKGRASSGCWGISVDPGNHLDESFVGLEIVGNTIRNFGGLGIGCASCKDVLIADNIIIDEADVMRNSIQVPNKREDSLKSENVTIRNNKIINNHQLGAGITIAGSNQFKAYGNEISLSSKDSRAVCIKALEANSETDVSKNSCDSHTSVKVMDEPINDGQEQVAEDSSSKQQESVTEQEELLTYQRPEGLVLTDSTVEKESDTSIILPGSGRGGYQEPTSSDTSDSSTSGSSTGTSESGTTSTQTALTSSNTQESTTVTQSTTSISTDISSTVEPVTADTTYQRPNTLIRAVTVNEVQNVTDNDISGVDEGQCKVFARGRCMMM